MYGDKAVFVGSLWTQVADKVPSLDRRQKPISKKQTVLESLKIDIPLYIVNARTAEITKTKVCDVF